MKSFKAIFRRGQKLDGQNTGDNLSRTSSITNLEAEGQQQKGLNNKGGKPKKSASRDRLDKLGESKKNDKKGVTKNNNKLDSGDSSYPSIDSLQEEDLLQLKRQLHEMEQEKKNLALQLGEQKGQLSILQKEIQKLKSFQEESNSKVEYLTEENTMLRNRLRDVAHSPLSDNEKQQLLFDSQRHHSSAPASIATNLVDEGNGADTTCTTPDWDKHSSSNVSEVSVACLQDKINQMQETHYSTNEELQATLQELTDLQRQLTELQQENERLTEEKSLMMDSLCRQTERLNESRSEVESLKTMLYREKDDTGQYESIAEREEKLVDMLKSAQEERETLMLKLEQMNAELQETRAAIVEKDERTRQLTERVKTLECALDAKHAEHKQLDQEIAQAKDQCSGKQIEINRLTDLLDNAKTKICELEQDRALSDKSELDEMLDNARKEKDALESEVAHLKEQLAISRNETEKLKEQMSILQEELKVMRNNAKTTQSDLEYKCEKLMKEKNAMSEQLLGFQEAINELQVQNQCQLEDKRQLSAVLSETQRNLSEAERKNLNLELEVEEVKKLRAEENDEWEKFQNDLLTSVRVANDFKTEAQQELQRMILENKTYRDRERQLKAEIEKLKGKLDKADGSAPESSKSLNKDTLTDHPDNRKSKSQRLIPVARSSKPLNKEKRPVERFGKPSRKLPDKSKSSVTSSSKSSNKENRNMDVLKKSADRNRDKPSTALFPTEGVVQNDPVHRPVKRRERKSDKRYKTLSIEEEILLNSLNSWHENIDKNIPDEELTEEQRAIRKLKVIYEDENLKMKPVARKPIDQLAVSKPLLDSVLNNDKLKEIAANTRIKTIDDIVNIEEPEIRNPVNIDRYSRAKSVNYRHLEKPNRHSVLSRSLSCDDNLLYEAENNSRLYRTVEAEDLTIDQAVKLRESNILPSDSISNLSFQSDIPCNRLSIRLSTLEFIVASIPTNTPESALTKEQKFALKLKAAIDEIGKKEALKKIPNARKLNVSAPTKESVMNDPSLRHILEDPHYKDLPGCNSDQVKSGPLRPSKSFDDLEFVFESGSLGGSWEVLSYSSSLSGAEFNVESGEIGAFNKEIFDTDNLRRNPYFFDLTSQDHTVVPKDEQEFDSLTYKDTMKMMKREFLNNIGRPIDYSSHDFSNKDKKQRYSDLKNDSETKPCSKTDGEEWNDGLVLRHHTERRYKSDPSREPFLDDTLSIGKTDSSFTDIYGRIERLRHLINEAQKSPAFRISNIVGGEAKGNTTNDTLDGVCKGDDDNSQFKVELTQEEYKKSKDVSIVDDENRNYIVSSNPTIDISSVDGSSSSKVSLSKVSPKDLIHPKIEIPEPDNNLQSSKMRDGIGRGNTIYTNDIIVENIPNREKITIEERVDLSPFYVIENEDTPINSETSGDTKYEDIKVISHLDSMNDTYTNPANSSLTALINNQSANKVAEEEYDYRSILRENRFGVTTPLTLRQSYRQVVTEYKHKFGLQEELVSKELLEGKLEDDDTVDNVDNFFEDFFKPKKDNINVTIDIERISPVTPGDQEIQVILDHYVTDSKASETLEDEISTSNLEDEIDKDMQEIIEKYLHQPVSKFITEPAYDSSKETDEVVEATIRHISSFETVQKSENSKFDEVLDHIEKVDSFIDNKRKSQLHFVEFKNLTVSQSQYAAEQSIATHVLEDPVYETGTLPNTQEVVGRTEEDSNILARVSQFLDNERNFYCPLEPIDSNECRLDHGHDGEHNMEKSSHVGEETLKLTIAPSPRARFKGVSKDEANILKLTRRQRGFRPHSEVVKSDIERFRKMVSDLDGNKKLNFGSKMEKQTEPSPNPVFESTSNIITKQTRNASGLDDIALRKTSSKETQRKVKSFADHFERLSLSQVYKRNPRLVTARETKPLAQAKEKPQARPRTRNQVAPRWPASTADTDKRIDSALKGNKMTEMEENFSEHHNDHVENYKVEAVTEVPGLHENLRMYQDKTGNEIENAESENVDVPNAAPVVNAERLLGSVLAEKGSNEHVEDHGNFVFGESVSVIAVSGKIESLNLTQSKNKVDESKLNLFHLDAQSLEVSPSDQGESSQRKSWEANGTNVFHSDVEECTDSGSDEETHINLDQEVGESSSKPKIIDFVPLDDATKPFFQKDDTCPTTYDTLERESAFQVLTTAAASALDDKQPHKKGGSSTSLPSRTSGNRDSFSAAKKMFEALSEANSSDVADRKSPSRNVARIKKS